MILGKKNHSSYWNEKSLVLKPKNRVWCSGAFLELPCLAGVPEKMDSRTRETTFGHSKSIFIKCRIYLWIYCLELYNGIGILAKRGIFFRENWFLYSESGRGVLYHWPGQSICIQLSSSGVQTGPITKWQMSTRCFSSPMLVVIREPESHLENRCSAKNSPLVKWNLFL